jgi:6,7-dimethyl-8-ribityllumazine synthase
MSDINVKEGALVVRDARIALLVSRFNSFVVESLLEGAGGACAGRIRDADSGATAGGGQAL